MNSKLWTLLFFALLWVSAAQGAVVEMGVGMNSATSGRLVPALAGAIGGSNWLITGTSTGVRSNYYYHSNYSLAWMRTWSAGDFVWGQLNAGFGLGAFYSIREFKDEGVLKKDEKSEDVGGGPTFRVRWDFLGPVYMNLEVIWGLRALGPNLTLNGQDLVTFSVGLWL